jgi:Inner membrane component of T3SS, cytoplasmic domain
MVPAFLVSMLSRQLALLGDHEFLRQHSHAWLVWEPGAWNPPRSPDESDLGATLFPRGAGAGHPEAGDALCFELVTSSNRAVLQVGRGPQCAIVLNDMTVSRVQCQLEFGDGEWQLRQSDASSEAVVLREKAAVRAGGLTLTFHSATGLVERLRTSGAHEQR